MKWIGLIMSLSCFLSGCALPTGLSAIAATGATALGQKGINVKIDVMSNNVTNNCTCQSCQK